MSNEQLVVALERARALGKGRMASVGDISCDIEVHMQGPLSCDGLTDIGFKGGLEFLTHASTLSEPFYTARPATIPPHLPGVQMMAVSAFVSPKVRS
jgi:alpha-aminoadipic semialdehyde synthase